MSLLAVILACCGCVEDKQAQQDLHDTRAKLQKAEDTIKVKDEIIEEKQSKLEMLFYAIIIILAALPILVWVFTALGAATTRDAEKQQIKNKEKT